MTRTDPRTVRSRQAMIEAAVRLLQRGGMDAVTHQTVAAEAGVGRATVYRHWPARTDLLLDALGDAVPVFDFGEGNLRSQLLHELGLRLPQINSAVGVAAVGVLVARGEHDEKVQHLRELIFGRVVDAITAVIAAASSDGQLVPTAPARELTILILGAVMLERTVLGRQVSPDHLAHIVDTALKGWWADR